MNSKYKVTKFIRDKLENIEDLISVEEPLEIPLKYKDKGELITKSLSVTMRTPGHDEDLVRGFLFNEQIIQNLNEIKEIKSIGNKVGQYNIQNKILITLNNSKNINISKIKKARPYLYVSSFVLAALLTPPDVLSQIFLALPMILLFELGLILSRVISK